MINNKQDWKEGIKNRKISSVKKIDEENGDKLAIIQTLDKSRTILKASSFGAVSIKASDFFKKVSDEKTKVRQNAIKYLKLYDELKDEIQSYFDTVEEYLNCDCLKKHKIIPQDFDCDVLLPDLSIPDIHCKCVDASFALGGDLNISSKLAVKSFGDWTELLEDQKVEDIQESTENGISVISFLLQGGLIVPVKVSNNGFDLFDIGDMYESAEDLASDFSQNVKIRFPKTEGILKGLGATSVLDGVKSLYELACNSLPDLSVDFDFNSDFDIDLGVNPKLVCFPTIDIPDLGDILKNQPLYENLRETASKLDPNSDPDNVLREYILSFDPAKKKTLQDYVNEKNLSQNIYSVDVKDCTYKP